MQTISDKIQRDTVTIAVILYNNMAMQDFSGPMEVFSKAQNLTKGKYKIFTVGLTSGYLNTENNLLTIKPDYTIESFPKADYIIIPDASMPIINKLIKDENLKSFIRVVLRFFVDLYVIKLIWTLRAITLGSF